MVRKPMRTAGGLLLVLMGVIILLPVLSAGDDPPASQSPPALPDAELGRTIQLGREIVEQTNTHPLSREFVGNDLRCTSCHLEAGTDPRAATFLSIATAYPAYSPREKRVITLEDRVLNCFMRSLNGVRPPLGSEVSVAITAYITWLSTGERIALNAEAPLGPRHVPPLKLDASTADAQQGAKRYAEQCADCHGDNGLGTDEGPPVWGDRSYNDGAGLARNDKLAAWLKVAMPLGDPSLSDRDALDIAAFVNSHARPRFVLKEHLPESERLGEYNAKD